MVSAKFSPTPRRVIVVDDHPIILQMVRRLLAEQPNFEVVGEATNGAQAVILVQILKPDVVVLDVAMPHMSGFEAARRIRKAMPSVAVVILSTHTDEHFLRKAKECGAKGFVRKGDASEHLVRAINTVTEGQEFFE
jgi:DNA-binding NarL/FixJ family response regulator